jgi:hypothetical protein
VDEGKQFYVGAINILGLDEKPRAQMLQDFFLQPGQIYNQRLVELSVLRDRSILPDCGCGERPLFSPDEKTGVVTLTFDFRPCLGAH